MKILHKTILRLKLTLGMLFLLLKGNDVKAQEIFDRATCYRYMPRGPRLHLHGDLSVGKSWMQTEKGGPLTFQFGHNHGKRTHGFRFDYQEEESRYGLFLRWFPYDNDNCYFWSCGLPITVFAETAILFPVNKEISNNSISVSYGVIVRDNSIAGIELFQAFHSDITVGRGYNFYTGIKLHFYFVRRRLP